MHTSSIYNQTSKINLFQKVNNLCFSKTSTTKKKTFVQKLFFKLLKNSFCFSPTILVFSQKLDQTCHYLKISTFDLLKIQPNSLFNSSKSQNLLKMKTEQSVLIQISLFQNFLMSCPEKKKQKQNSYMCQRSGQVMQNITWTFLIYGAISKLSLKCRVGIFIIVLPFSFTSSPLHNMTHLKR